MAPGNDRPRDEPAKSRSRPLAAIGQSLRRGLTSRRSNKAAAATAAAEPAQPAAASAESPRSATVSAEPARAAMRSADQPHATVSISTAAAAAGKRSTFSKATYMPSPLSRGALPGASVAASLGLGGADSGAAASSIYGGGRTQRVASASGAHPGSAAAASSAAAHFRKTLYGSSALAGLSKSGYASSSPALSAVAPGGVAAGAMAVSAAAGGAARGDAPPPGRKGPPAEPAGAGAGPHGGTVNRDYSFAIAASHPGATAQSARSSAGAPMLVAKEGYLSKKTDINPSTSLASALSRGWKVYRVVLKGAKIFFYKPPSESEMRAMFPEETAAATNETAGGYFRSSMAVAAYDDMGSSSGGPGFPMSPGEVDSGSRAILFEPGVCDGEITAPLCERYTFGECFTEVDLRSLKFKRYVSVLIFDDTIVVLKRRWVRQGLASSFFGAVSNKMRFGKGTRAKTSQPTDSSSLVSSELGIAGKGYFTKWKYHSQYPLTSAEAVEAASSRFSVAHAPGVLGHLGRECQAGSGRISLYSIGNSSVSSIMTRTSTLSKDYSGALASGLVPGFQLFIGGKERVARMFVATTSDAKNTWLSRFAAAKASYARRLRQRPRENTATGRLFSSAGEQQRPVTAALGKDAFAEPALVEDKAKQPKDTRTRLFWGTQRHPELVVAERAALAAGAEAAQPADDSCSTALVVIGGSRSALVHEMVFRTAASATGAASFSAQLVGTYPLLMSHADFLGELQRYAGLVMQDTPGYAALVAGLGEIVMGLAVQYAHVYDAEQIEILRTIVASAAAADPEHDAEAVTAVTAAIDRMVPVAATAASDDASKSQNTAGPSADMRSPPLSGLESYEIIGSISSAMGTKISADVTPRPPRGRSKTHHGEPEPSVPQIPTVPELARVEITGLTPSLLLRVPPDEFAHQLYLFHKSQLAGFNPKQAQLYIPLPSQRSSGSSSSAACQQTPSLLTIGAHTATEPSSSPARDAVRNAGPTAAGADDPAAGSLDVFRQLMVFTQNEPHFITRLIHHHLLVELPLNRPARRSALLQQWVRIGEECRAIGDAVSWAAIAMAVTMAPIARLRETWHGVALSWKELIVAEWVPLLVAHGLHEADIDVPGQPVDAKPLVIRPQHKSGASTPTAGAGYSYTPIPFYGTIRMRIGRQGRRLRQAYAPALAAAGGSSGAAGGAGEPGDKILFAHYGRMYAAAHEAAASIPNSVVERARTDIMRSRASSMSLASKFQQGGPLDASGGIVGDRRSVNQDAALPQIAPLAVLDPSILSHPYLQSYLRSLALNPLKIGDELAGADAVEYDLRYLLSISLQCEPSVGDLYHQHMLQDADSSADDAGFAQPSAPSALRQAPGSILPLVCPETVPSTNILQWITPAARTPAPQTPAQPQTPMASRTSAMPGRAGAFSRAPLRPDSLALGSSAGCPPTPRKASQGTMEPMSPAAATEREQQVVREKRSQSFPAIIANDSAEGSAAAAADDEPADGALAHADGSAGAGHSAEQQQISDAAQSHAVFSGTTVYAANGDLALGVLRVQHVRQKPSEPAPVPAAVSVQHLRFVVEVQGGTLPIMLDLLINGIEHYSAGLVTDKGVPIQLPEGVAPALVFNRDVFQRTFMASFRHFCTGPTVVASMRRSLAQFSGHEWSFVEASLTTLLDVCENWLGQHFADFLDSMTLRDAMAEFASALRGAVEAQQPEANDAQGSWKDLCERATMLTSDLATQLLTPSGYAQLEKVLDRRLACAVSRERRESASAQLDVDMKSPISLLSVADPDVVLVSLNRLAQTHFARCSFNDWLVAFCLLEVQTHAPLPWYPKKRMAHVPPEEDLTVSDIYQVLEQTHRGRNSAQAHELSGTSVGAGVVGAGGVSVSTVETSLMRTLPHSIQTMLELHRTIRGWVVRQIADPTISLTQRVARIQKFLTIIRLCRKDSHLATSHVFGSLLNSYMREAGMIPDRQPSYRVGSIKRYNVGSRVAGETGRRGKRKGGHSQAKYVPSFVERAVASALVSPESRQFVRAWNEVAAENSTKLETLEAALRGARDWAAFNATLPAAKAAAGADDGNNSSSSGSALQAGEAPRAIPVHRSRSNPTVDGIDVSEDSMARADCFVPCLGWLLENMVSLCYDTPDSLSSDARLVNLAKRHRVYIMLCICDQLASRCQEAFALPTKIRIDNGQFGTWVAQAPLRMADLRAASSAEMVLASESAPIAAAPAPSAGSAAAAGGAHASGPASDRSFSFSLPLAHAPGFGRPSESIASQTLRHAHVGGFTKRSITNLRGAPSGPGATVVGGGGGGGDARVYGGRKASTAVPHATPDFGSSQAFGSPPAPTPRTLAFPDGSGAGAPGAGGAVGGGVGGGAVYMRPFTRLVTDEIEKARQEIRERERLERELRDREQAIERQKNERTKILKRRLKEQQQRRAKNEPLLKMASLMNKVGGISTRESAMEGAAGAAPGGIAHGVEAQAGNRDSNRLSAASTSRPRGPALPSTKPANVINLINSTIAIEPSYTKRDFVFRVVTEEGGQYLLQAPDQEQMEEWIGAMRDAATEAAARRLTLFVEEAKKHNAGDSGAGGSSGVAAGMGDTDAPAYQPHNGRHPSSETTRSRFTAFLGGAAALGALGMSSSSSSASASSRGALAAAPPAKEPMATADPKTFGVDLAKQMPDPKVVPVIVEKCLAEIENRGLEEVGIYRVSGAAADVSRLRNMFNADPDAVDLGSGEFDDINVVSGVIKQFLRELPEPLLTFSLYDGFINAASIDDYDERLWAIKDLVQALPMTNYTVLKRLVEHLERVTDYEEVNHMYGTNLALVFGPSLLRPPPGTSSFALAMSNLGHAQSVIKNIILQYHWIFNVEEEAEPMADGELEEPSAAADDAPPEAAQESRPVDSAADDDDDMPLGGLAVDVKQAKRASVAPSPLTPSTQADMDQLAAAVDKLSV